MENAEIQLVRDLIPATKSSIFLDSAGSSLMSNSSMKVMSDYMIEESIKGGYTPMMERASEFQEFYKEAAILINCQPRNIAYQNSATDAYSKVLYSIVWKENDYVLTTKTDYVSNLLSFYNIRNRYGVKLEFVENLPSGDIDLNDLEEKLSKFHPKLFALTHIPTNAGLIQDAEKCGEICSKYDTLYLLDACQSIGQIVVDTNKNNCDFLTVTGRKFLRGPRGTGFLYVSDDILETEMLPTCFDLSGSTWDTEEGFQIGSDATRFEVWERNYSNLLGLTQAIRELNNIGIQKTAKYNKSLQKHFRENLSKVKDLQIFDQGLETGSIITWKIVTKSLSQHQEMLSELNVIYSLAGKMSALIDMNEKQQDWLIRFSPHYFNTIVELDTVVDHIASSE